MTDIKPMQLGEILDGALTIFGRNLGLFVALGIIALAGPLIFFAVLSGPMAKAFLPLALQMRMGGAQPSFAQWQPLLPLMGLLLVGLVFYYIASYFLAAGAMRIISDTYLGRRPQLGDALSLGASKMLPLVGVALCKVALLSVVWFGCVIAVVVLASLMGLVSSGAAVLAGLAGFGGAIWVVAFVMCGYGVTAQVLTLEEGVGVFGAFARSWDLTRQRKLKVFWTALLSTIVFYLIPYVIVIVVATVLRGMSPPLSRLVGALSQFLPIACAPLVVSCLTLLYYDLRVRREGFDLQLLSQRLGVG